MRHEQKGKSFKLERPKLSDSWLCYEEIELVGLMCAVRVPKFAIHVGLIIQTKFCIEFYVHNRVTRLVIFDDLFLILLLSPHKINADLFFADMAITFEDRYVDPLPPTPIMSLSYH